MDSLASRMDSLEERMDSLASRMDGLEERMDGLEERTDSLEEQVAVLRRQQQEQRDWFCIQLRRSENMILAEIERQRKIVDERFDRMERVMEQIISFYHISQLDTDRVKMLEDKVVCISGETEDLQRRVGLLEQQRA